MRAQFLVLFDHQKVNTQQTGNRKHTWVLITTINLKQVWTLSTRTHCLLYTSDAADDWLVV